MMISKAHKVNYNNTGRRPGSIAPVGKPSKCSRCPTPPTLAEWWQLLTRLVDPITVTDLSDKKKSQVIYSVVLFTVLKCHVWDVTFMYYT